MTQEDFKKYIEWPINRSGITSVNNAKEAEIAFWRRLELSSTISRTIQICLKYPDLAKEYLDNLPKATMD